MEEDLKRGRQLITRLELIQYRYFNGRPKWTAIEFEDLKLFMAYTYFGCPFNDLEDNYDMFDSTDDIFEHYKNEEKQCILDMIKIIKQNVIERNVSKIEVGFTITHSICKMKCNVCQNFPDQDIHQWYLLRIKLNHISVAYIDLHHKRTYKNWSDYIGNNTLPKGFMFYPESGYYEEANYLFQNLTPPSRKTEKILSYFDLLGKAGNFASGILLAGGLIFPVLSPVLIPAAITSGSFCTWEAGRQISKLADLSLHSQSLVSKEAAAHWFNLTVSALGLITAPMSATVRTLELSNSAIMATRLGKSMSILQKGACVTQCSLEVIRLVGIIKNRKTVTLSDIITLRLDLFVVIGLLLPITHIQRILESVANEIVVSPLYSNILEMPFCLDEIFKAVCFVKKHFTVFIEQVTKFLNNDLTADKLLFGLKKFQEFTDFYKKQLGLLNVDELLIHIVNDTITSECKEPKEVKQVLCSRPMKELLKKIETMAKTDRRLIKFCVKYVMEKAEAVATNYNEVTTILILRGEVNVSKIEKEFCKQYGLEKCCMRQFVLYGIKETAGDLESFINVYEQHILKPENIYDEQLVACETVGPRSLHTYTLVAPCSNLDSTTCVNFAKTVDSQNHEYSNYKYIQTEPSVSILFSVSGFSIKIVFFSIHTFDHVPSMHISFFRDTLGSVNRRLKCEETPGK